MNIINEFGYRQDGRKPDQIRNIVYKMGVIPEADGSVYFEQGKLKVICAVYGPHECRHRARINEEACVINAQYSVATFAMPERRARPRGDRRGNKYARLIERAFEQVILTELYARSQIDIFCELLEADGGALAACVSAASLALADAGVPMRGLLAGTECGSVDGVPCVDMSAREHAEYVPRLTIATTGGRDEIVLIDMKNVLNAARLPDLLGVGVAACAQVHACLETAVLNSIKEAYRIGGARDATAGG